MNHRIKYLFVFVGKSNVSTQFNLGAIEFLESIATKATEKLIFNISKAQAVNDARVFKKLFTQVKIK